jgi:hypothetical protein
MEITLVDFVSSEVEDEEEVGAKQGGDNHVGPTPPITTYDLSNIKRMSHQPLHQSYQYHIRKYPENFEA